MLLYNETIGIDKDSEQEWLTWMKDIYMPAMMSTGVFTDCKIYRILHENDDGSISYSTQYFAKSIDQIQQYLDVHAPNMVEGLRQKFANKHVVFRTLLEEV
jgi:hypothetical protein